MKRIPALSAPLEDLSVRACRSSAPLSRLIAWLGSERRDLWVVVAYAIGIGVFTLATPLAIQALIDTVAFGTLVQPLIVLALLLAAALGFSAVLHAVELYLVEYLGRRIFLRTAIDFSRRLPKVIRSKLAGKDLDELSNRFIDVVVIEKSLAEWVFDGTSAVLQISAALLLLAIYHPILLAFDLTLIAAIAFVVLVLGRRAIDTALDESKQKYVLLAWLQDIASNTVTFRSARGEAYVEGRTDRLAEAWLSARRGHFHVQFRQVVGMLWIQVVATTGLLALGGYLVVQRQLSLGQLVAAEVLITVTVSSLAKLGRLFPKFYDMLAAFDKVGRVLDLPVADRDGEQLHPTTAGIALEVNLPGLDLEIHAGESKIICASERREALHLVDAFLSPRAQARGSIRLESVDLLDLEQSALHDQVLLLRSDGLFPGTIIDNVALGDDDLDRTRIRRVLETAGVQQRVEELSDGINTMLNRAGQPLDLADQARLLLARALAVAPRLLVVDRVFDTLRESERREIIGLLADPARPWTVVYITAHGSDSRIVGNDDREDAVA